MMRRTCPASSAAGSYRTLEWGFRLGPKGSRRVRTSVRGRHSPRSAVAFSAVDADCGRGVTVDVRVEVSPGNSRILAAAVDVQAPVQVVWDCLTDYEHLQEFIPGLVENDCLERRPQGAVLRQVGAQDVAMGMKFCALAVLEISEHLTGLAEAECWELSGPNVKSCTIWDEDLGMFPCPRTTSNGIRPRDLSFKLREGDFQSFRGLWRMMGDAKDPNFTRLSYSVFIRPQRWLPVRLIEKRIVRESQKNLIAVREHAQKLFEASQDNGSDGS